MDDPPEPDPFTDPVRQWVVDHHDAVLVTLRRDGSPQSSNVVFTFDGHVARVSVTADRAKTRNVQRDPRVMLHVLGDTFWQYAAIQALGRTSAVTVEPGDEVGRELLEMYEAIAGPHPDPDEFLDVMTAEHRVVLTLIPQRVTTAGV